MKLIIMFLSLVGIFLALVQPTVAVSIPDDVSTRSDMPYPVEVMKYRGLVGEHEVELDGTVQEILTRMESLYPEFDRRSLPRDTTALEARPLETRNKNGLICWPVPGQPWNHAFSSGVNIGTDELMTLGRITVNAKTCTQIACWDDAGMYFCNDLAVTVNPALPYLATYVLDIMNQCMDSNSFVGGQEFDSDGYNIIVRADTCRGNQDINDNGTTG